MSGMVGDIAQGSAPMQNDFGMRWVSMRQIIPVVTRGQLATRCVLRGDAPRRKVTCMVVQAVRYASGAHGFPSARPTAEKTTQHTRSPAMHVLGEALDAVARGGRTHGGENKPEYADTERHHRY